MRAGIFFAEKFEKEFGMVSLAGRAAERRLSMDQDRFSQAAVDQWMHR